MVSEKREKSDDTLQFLKGPAFTLLSLLQEHTSLDETRLKSKAQATTWEDFLGSRSEIVNAEESRADASGSINADREAHCRQGWHWQRIGEWLGMLRLSAESVGSYGVRC
jgi:hypothetical protein